MTLDLKELRRVAGEASGSRPDAPPVSLYRRVAAFSRAANPATVIALLDEIRRLNCAVQYEQHRTERIGTHGPGCWKWGPSHWECSVDRVAELEARNRLLDALLKESQPYGVPNEIYARAEARAASTGGQDE